MNNIFKMEHYISIGELSRLSGIGVHTLRVWEKRYGAPRFERLPSGHRRYLKEEVPRLRAIAKALESGYRASKIVTRTLEELQSLLGVQHLVSSTPEETKSATSGISKEITIEKWIEAVHQYYDESLIHSIYDIWNKEGPLNFVLDYVGPFLKRIGEGWSTGELNVCQEHFASEILSDFLSSKWRQLNTQKDGSIAVLATLPGETHALGLLMCAVVTSLAKFKVIYLGPDSPMEDIIKTTDDCNAQLLCLSISNCVNRKKAKDDLKQIRNTLKKEINMVIGGEGAIDAAPGVLRLNDFTDFYEWVNQLNM